jgi:hypothetical protein
MLSKFLGAHMKNTTRSNICLLMAATILTAALAVPAAAQNQVPFKGTFQGNDTTNETAATIATAATGTGTHLGQFNLTQRLALNFENFTDTGSAEWIAANGDIINTQSSDRLYPVMLSSP